MIPGADNSSLFDTESTDLIPKPDVFLSDNASGHPSIHTRTGENNTKIWLGALIPLILHFLSVIGLTVILNFSIDQHDFNLHSRSALTNFTPLQSDITTAVSAGVTVLRFFAAIWSGKTIWRCIFILMEKGGISLEQINSLLFWQHHFHPRANSSQRIGLLISITLLLSFPCQLSGPILTGSITWSPSSGLIKGNQLTGISKGHPVQASSPDVQIPFPLNFSDALNGVYGVSPPIMNSVAIIAWQGSRDDHRTMKRVLFETDSEPPINSTLNNITLPYFAVSKLEWIKDPVAELPPTVLDSHLNLSDWNGFRRGDLFAKSGTFAIIPEAWGIVSPPSPYTGIISETRVIVGKTANSCDDTRTFGNLTADIGRHETRGGCFIYGRLTYSAGAAECTNCRISSWLTVQNDTELSISPDRTTVYALTMMPLVGGVMTLRSFSLPRTFNNLDEYVTEFFIRSYGAAWTVFTTVLQPEQVAPTTTLQSNVQIAVPTSRANIMWWRVSLWLVLNVMFTFSGLLFLFIQSTCALPLIGKPFMAALLLDTTEVHHKRNRALCNFSTLVEDDRHIGYLYLQKSKENGHKHVVVMDY